MNVGIPVLIKSGPPTLRLVEVLGGGDAVAVVDPAGKTPYGIASEISERAEAGSVCVMPVEFACEGFERSAQPGAEVLKYLRIADRFGRRVNRAQRTPCVLYSPRTLLQLLRHKPSSLILTAPGVHVLEYPLDFRDLDLEGYASVGVPPIDYSPYARVGFTLPDERHSPANWWAARQTHLAAHYSLRRDYEDDLFFSDIDEPVLRDALYLYGEQGRIRNLLEGEVRNQLYGLRTRVLRNLARQSRGDLRKQILLIDDAADRAGGDLTFGWTFVLNDALRPRWDHEWEEDEEPVVDGIKDLGLSHAAVALDRLTARLSKAYLDRFACVLLDMRLLRHERGPVEEPSGIGVLRHIRSLRSSMPVVVMTASNKAETALLTAAEGANWHWVKHGLDEVRSPQRVVDDFVDLLCTIEAATGEATAYLAASGDHLAEVGTRRAQGDLWWQGPSWTRTAGGLVDAQSVVWEAQQALLAAQEALVLSSGGSLNPHHPANEASRRRIGACYVSMSRCLEALHRTADQKPPAGEDYPPPASRTIKGNGYYYHNDIYQKRNSLVHKKSKAKSPSLKQAASDLYLLSASLLHKGRRLRDLPVSPSDVWSAS